MTISCNGIYFFDHSAISTFKFVAKNPALLPKNECPHMGISEDEWGALNWWSVLDNQFVQFHLQSEPQVKKVEGIVTEITYTHEGKTATLMRITKEVYDKSVKMLLRKPKDLKDDASIQAYLVNYNTY